VSNSRSFRRRLAASKTGRAGRGGRKTRARFPWGPPSVSTVRKQLRQLEAEGYVEQSVEHTGKPGRPPHVWQLTEKGRDRRDWSADELETMITTAVNERRFKDVPYLLPLLRMKDRERAKRLEKSLVRHGYRAKTQPRGRHVGPWRPRSSREASPLSVRAVGADMVLETMAAMDREAAENH
jgi:DNA-binding PadR family transcriptional regulator